MDSLQLSSAITLANSVPNRILITVLIALKMTSHSLLLSSMMHRCKFKPVYLNAIQDILLMGQKVHKPVRNAILPAKRVRIIKWLEILIFVLPVTEALPYFMLL